jgi:hypothetical protein
MKRKPKFDRTTWRQYGYLEGLRKARNHARKQAKIRQDTSEHKQAVGFKIGLEKLYKIECERLSKLNPRLKSLIEKISPNFVLEQKINFSKEEFIDF